MTEAASSEASDLDAIIDLMRPSFHAPGLRMLPAEQTHLFDVGVRFGMRGTLLWLQEQGIVDIHQLTLRLVKETDIDRRQRADST